VKTCNDWNQEYEWRVAWLFEKYRVLLTTPTRAAAVPAPAILRPPEPPEGPKRRRDPYWGSQ
jgi:hypothetical protein